MCTHNLNAWSPAPLCLKSLFPPSPADTTTSLIRHGDATVSNPGLLVLYACNYEYVCNDEYVCICVIRLLNRSPAHSFNYKRLIRGHIIPPLPPPRPSAPPLSLHALTVLIDGRTIGYNTQIKPGLLAVSVCVCDGVCAHFCLCMCVIGAPVHACDFYFSVCAFTCLTPALLTLAR